MSAIMRDRLPIVRRLLIVTGHVAWALGLLLIHIVPANRRANWRETLLKHRFTVPRSPLSINIAQSLTPLLGDRAGDWGENPLQANRAQPHKVALSATSSWHCGNFIATLLSIPLGVTAGNSSGSS